MHRSLFMMVFLVVGGGLLPASVRAQEPPKKIPPQLEALFKGSADDFIKHFDKNKKGYLTKEDLPPFLAKNFEKFDTNNDGKLDKAEVERLLTVVRKRMEANKTEPEPDKAKPGPANLKLADFDALDKKATGRITRDMVKGTPYEALFDQIDTNKDGKIDRKEFEAFIKKQEKDRK
jgi:hypothetical protein